MFLSYKRFRRCLGLGIKAAKNLLLFCHSDETLVPYRGSQTFFNATQTWVCWTSRDLSLKQRILTQKWFFWQKVAKFIFSVSNLFFWPRYVSPRRDPFLGRDPSFGNHCLIGTQLLVDGKIIQLKRRILQTSNKLQTKHALARRFTLAYFFLCLCRAYRFDLI